MADKRDKWDQDRALAFLKTQGIMPIDNVIELSASDTPGLTSWGAIDFLRNYCGFRVQRAK